MSTYPNLFTAIALKAKLIKTNIGTNIQIIRMVNQYSNIHMHIHIFEYTHERRSNV